MCDTKKKLAKPKMRGLLKAQIQRNIPIAILLSIASGVLWKIFVADARKKKYAEFYKNYDAEADFQRMLEAGVFTCCEPSIEEEDEDENGGGGEEEKKKKC